MSTTLTVNLSAALKTTIQGLANGGEGLYIYAAGYVGKTGLPIAANGIDNYITIVDGSAPNPTVPDSVTINLPSLVDGGKIYFIIQSVTAGNPSGLFGSGGRITEESDLNWGNAGLAGNDFRYDSFEFSLLGLAGDAGNLTDVNGFGIPMSVSIGYPNGAATQTRGYKVDAADIFSQISGITATPGALIQEFTEGPLQGTHRMAAAPATALTQPTPFGASATDWRPYVESLGVTGAIRDLKISGYFNGAPSVEWMDYAAAPGGKLQYSEYHNPGFYSYTVEYAPDPGLHVYSGTYVLTPTSNSQIKGTIKIKTAELENSIYSTLGSATIQNPDGSSYQFSGLNTAGEVVVGPDMNTGANNQWGASFVKLLTGFIGGYFGSTATPLNPLLGTASSSLSDTSNFDPTFAFGGSIAAGQPGAVTPWSWGTSWPLSPVSGVHYDPYAKIFFENTNSYGNGYSDALMSLFQQGGPLIPTGYNFALASNPFATALNSGVITVTDPNTGPHHYAVGDLVSFGGVPGFAAGNGQPAVNMNQTFAITSVDASAGTYQVTLPGGAVAGVATNFAGGDAVVAAMDVKAISLTLFDGIQPIVPPAHTLPETQGYTPTEIFNTYLSSVDPSGLVTPLSGTPLAPLSLIISTGAGQVRVDPDATVSLGFYTGQPGGLATFQSVELPTHTPITTYGGSSPFTTTDKSNVILVTDVKAAQYAAQGASVTFSGATGFAGIDASALNQTFQITKVVDATHYQIQIGTAATSGTTGGGTVAAAAKPILDQTWIFNPGTQPSFTPGGAPSATGSFIQLNGLPYESGINWYQLSITKGGASRSFNMYMDGYLGTTIQTSGILNPQYPGNNPGTIALDNLAALPAVLPPSKYLTSVNVGLFNGLAPSMLTLITDSAIIGAASNNAAWPLTANIEAPVLGTLSGSTFTNWTTGGATPAYSYNTPNSGLTDVTTGSLALAWFGADQQWVGYNAYNGGGTATPINVIGGYTNKVIGSDVALLTFSSNGFTAHNPIAVTADIDGKWVSGATQFGNGTYSVTMSEYLPGDVNYTTPVNNPSSTLQFTVNATPHSFANTAGNNFLALDSGGSTSGGSWIRLETTGSSMPNGTLLAFATDALGNMIGRDGNITTDLNAAVLAQIGAVAFDNGTMMAAGIQSVYLPLGQQLHFAVQTGNNAVEQLPGVQVSGGGALSISVNGSYGTLNLHATVDNNLSASASLAGSQRDYNQPWAYLTQGQGVNVEVAGSAWNMNTIHFVQIDVDPATNAWSVGGVAYGNTDAFRSAVASNWDPGFAATGGRGNFGGTTGWTASSGTGFYAPVLATEGGDIFVIGNANVDGQNHIRMFGQNVFGFEDLRADQRSDFDYNDVVVKLTLA